ncbi:MULTISPECIES: enhanced serine sensitivity protein SseB C-terminal domain-containing protein [unclassified Chelatococcus]|uniref:enhanced serine sensitivity protein SseB C-terminal domain-containing protein n=1 Tax=unclassified Chelatococcus TaxID=2638111 RepID=UPI001BCBF9A6|nr:MULTISPECIES: enhanced serine sensitivity protein SseB C-terminal domain-containing protein [unclassified Chelatococcus]MBS7697409.1 enhanced serine sensitivity protein SseB C-terminal domain-containing protein [Chelatococcus sp. YT9]MBX3559978.1 enhanced serine sensitivity protein SseB C-terminal domain-containing protein [Chelatococcus sp.]
MTNPFSGLRFTSLRGEAKATFAEQEANSAARTEAPASTLLFEPRNELERLLVEATRDPAQRPLFLHALMRSYLYVELPPGMSPDTSTLQPGARLQLHMVTGPDGNAVPAIFTSEERVADARGAVTSYLGIKAEDLFNLVAATGAFLNPGTPYGLYWTASELARLLGRPDIRIVETETRVMLGAPEVRPEQLIASLTRAFKNDARIREAWLALAYWPATNERSWFLDVRSDISCKASYEELRPLIGEAIQQAGPLQYPVDTVVDQPPAPHGQGIRIKPAQVQ